LALQAAVSARMNASSTMRRMADNSRSLCVGAVLVVVAGCGGESRYRVPGSDSARPSAAPNATATSRPTAEPDPGTDPPVPHPPVQPAPVVNPIPECAGFGAGPPTDPSSCPDRLLEVSPLSPEAQCLPSGIVVEPLQIPDLTVGAYDWEVDERERNADPSTWDRSPLPAGACVFRLHGVNANCYPGGGLFYVGDCRYLKQPRPAPGGFYEGNHCGVEPGCATARASGTASYWWYLVDRGSAADLVICAPECAQSFVPYGGCLSLESGPSHCE
jgi:hypothetical protein